jgi:coenzyme F420 hydrogenase subunit beta
MRRQFATVVDAAERGLCTGCGACAYMDSARVRMTDTLTEGRRPVLVDAGAVSADGDATRSKEALAVCPGLDQTHEFDRGAWGLDKELADTWGPVLEMWEGYAIDPLTRFRASSGGAASALATYCIEKGGMHGLLHIAQRKDVPYLNETVMSTSRDEIVARSGSRYAPASPCDGLAKIENAPAPCVFIGKPCDVLGAQRARRFRPKLDRNLGLVIGFFCAGTPTTAGTMAMLAKMGVEDPKRLRSLRYRGDGWPGKATAVVEKDDGALETRQLTYHQSWGEVLADHKQWRCNLCPDRTGESADISVGDPWWNGVPDDAPGRSLILVRTERGRRLLRDAVAAGYIAAEPAESWKLRASQKGFPKVRGAIWGRLVALRLMLVASPTHRGFSLFTHWRRELTIREKAKSLLGTARRVVLRNLWRRRPIEPLEAPRP